MKAVNRKILCWLLVLTMVTAMIPAALAAEGDDPVRLESISLEPNTLELKVGESATLTVITTPAEYPLQDSEIVWTSQDDQIATVSGGQVEAVSAGTVTIIAQVGDLPASCTVTVTGGEAPVTALTLSESSISIDAATEPSATVTAEITGGADGMELVISPEGSEIAELAAAPVKDGASAITVTPKKVGTETFTVSCGEASAELTVTVTASAYTLTFENDPLEIKAGETGENPVKLVPANDAATFTYASEDEAIATVDADGVVTGVSVGETKITVTAFIGELQLAQKTYTVKVLGTYKLTIFCEKKGLTVGAAQPVEVSVSALQEGGKYATYKGSVDFEWKLDSSSYIAAFKSKTSQASSGESSNTLLIYSTGTRAQSVIVKMEVVAKFKTKDGQSVELKGTESIVISPAEATTFYAEEGKKFSADAFASVVDSAVANNETKVSMNGIGIRAIYGGKIYDGSATNEIKGSENPTIYTSATSAARRINDLYFVGAANTTEKKSFDYIAFNKDGYVIAIGMVMIGANADIEYSTSTGTTVRFKEADFYNFVVGRTSSKELSYVLFDVPSAKVSYAGKTVSLSSYESSFGAFYTDSTQKSRLYSSDRCYYKATSLQTALSAITYAPGSYSKAYTVTLPFTAYYTSGSSILPVEGFVYIYVNDNEAMTMVGAKLSTAGASKTVTKAYPTAAYVMVSLPKRDEGTLLYNFRSIVRQNYTAVAETDKLYLADSKQTLLDDVYFLPAADCANTIRIAYTAYDSSNNRLGSNYLTLNITKIADSGVFADVTSKTCGSWAADAVDFMNYYGLVRGVSATRFNYGGNMTRGDFVLILYRYAGEPSVSGASNPFRDLKTTDYYYSAVLWAYQNNVVTGTSSTTFSPKGNITREQIAAILYRMTRTPSGSASLTSFADYQNVSSYAEAAMSWAVGNGYVKGSGRFLNPKNNATRAEVVVMLHRFLTK